MKTIQTFLSSPFNSNTYVICSEISNKVIVVDPGDPDSLELLDYLISNNKEVSGVIITHEHFDHIAGLNTLREKFQYQLIASEACLINIKNPNITLSKYIQSSFLQPSDLVFEDVFVIEKDLTSVVFDDFVFDFIITPGHSDGGICIKMNNVLFTGDTLLGDVKIFTKFPGGNKKYLEESLVKIDSILSEEVIIYPGHGLPFKKHQVN